MRQRDRAPGLGDPTGESIDLAVARTRATGTRIGTLVTNPGGPGASGIEFLGRSPLGTRLAENFDIVSWDPRGVGASAPVECDEHTDELYLADPTPEDDAERAAAQQVAAQVAEDCGAAGGPLLEQLSTAEVARDLEAIRLALGSEKLNYLGFSYGTRIGQEYADLFGDRIRSMALDGVVDPALGFEEFLIEQAEAFDAAFERHADACTRAGEPECGVADLIDAYNRVVEATEASTIDAQGTSLEPAQVVTAATYTAYMGDGWALLGPALADALAGDGTDLAELAASYVGLSEYGPYAGVVCTDTAHPDGPAAYQAFMRRATQASARFGASVAGEMMPCATWLVAAQDTARAITAPDAPPILVVGNTGDPATPLSNAESVAESLHSGVLLVVESEGHTAHGSNACAAGIIDAYLIDLEIPEPGTRC
ncbi:MAG: alpha/beta hydrolase [Microthrixaceae bacterium]|nr:alpha/beta hydrolase [Microthrixaceae bacterium]